MLQYFQIISLLNYQNLMALSISSAQQSVHDSTKWAMVAAEDHTSWRLTAAEWRPPAFPAAVSKEQEPIIPAPKLFQSLSETPLPINDTSLPSIADCAVHLELLQAFYFLRRRVLLSTAMDKVLGIKAEPKEVWRAEPGSYYRPVRKQIKIRDQTFAERRQIKWTLFINCAVVRFVDWAKMIDDTACAAISPRLPPLGQYFEF